MSARPFHVEVARALADRLDIGWLRVEADGDAAVVYPPETGADGMRSARCEQIAQVLTAAGYHCTRSRTRVRVTRVAPPPLEEPDFVCRRNRA